MTKLVSALCRALGGRARREVLQAKACCFKFLDCAALFLSLTSLGVELRAFGDMPLLLLLVTLPLLLLPRLLYRLAEALWRRLCSRSSGLGGRRHA